MPRAACLAALAALLICLLAGAPPEALAAKAPVVTKVTPMNVAVGEKLTIRGRHFRRGRKQNTVVFKRNGSRAVFVKADLGTTKMLTLKVPAKLQQYFAVRNGQRVPTRFRLRVLTSRFGRRFTRQSRSPLISAARPPEGDCDGDGERNRFDDDDDNDLLSDSVESRIATDPCAADTDADGVEDGYEYQSARDLNDDEYQEVNGYLPSPEKRPYPNALDGTDGGTDFDGDSLTLGEEQALWRFSYQVTRTDVRTLAPLSYSDGHQYSRSVRQGGGRRQPTLAAAGYDKQADFLAWASAAGYRTVHLRTPFSSPGGTYAPYGLFDADRNGAEEEYGSFDRDANGYLSDDERDEDADGLTNYDETHGRVTRGYWNSCYGEQPFHIAYGGTDVADPDSDGDGVRDGADDQDHDDIPNILELSRIAASNTNDNNGRECQVADPEPAKKSASTYGRVNPFNPCLPDRYSRTCPRYVNDTTGAPFDGDGGWHALQ
jgi:hypothetical protein